MTKKEAQTKAESIFETSHRFAFVFQAPKGFVIGTADRGAGWCRNFTEVGFGDSWESALDDAEHRQKESK